MPVMLPEFASRCPDADSPIGPITRGGTTADGSAASGLGDDDDVLMAAPPSPMALLQPVAPETQTE